MNKRSTPSGNVLNVTDHIEKITHYGNITAFTIIVASQFIYLNFHYIIGATLTIIGICSIIAQVILSMMEHYFLENKKLIYLKNTIDIHYWINRIVVAISIPFLIWVVVLMFQQQQNSSDPV